MQTMMRVTWLVHLEAGPGSVDGHRDWTDSGDGSFQIAFLALLDIRESSVRGADIGRIEATFAVLLRKEKFNPGSGWLQVSTLPWLRRDKIVPCRVPCWLSHTGRRSPSNRRCSLGCPVLYCSRPDFVPIRTRVFLLCGSVVLPRSQSKMNCKIIHWISYKVSDSLPRWKPSTIRIVSKNEFQLQSCKKQKLCKSVPGPWLRSRILYRANRLRRGYWRCSALEKSDEAPNRWSKGVWSRSFEHGILHSSANKKESDKVIAPAKMLTKSPNWFMPNSNVERPAL